MIRIGAIFLSMLLAGCAAGPEPRVGLPWSLMDQDRGDLSGVWRQVRSNGRSVSRGYQLTIDLTIGTFAVQKGCAADGGVLRPLGGDRFRLEPYRTGFAAEGCPPWRSDPALAPFDAAELQLVRQGRRLAATAASGSAEFVRLTRG